MSCGRPKHQQCQRRGGTRRASDAGITFLGLEEYVGFVNAVSGRDAGRSIA